MRKRKVLSRKRIPVKLPLFQSLTIVLALDHWNAPGLLWGVGLTFLTLLWLIVISAKATEKEVDFED